jgi:hypothetical protein
MAGWGWIAATYGAVTMAVSLARLRGGRRVWMALSAVAYAIVGAWLSTSTRPWVHLVAPAVVLVTGYWLSGPFLGNPQRGLENWLLDLDARAMADLGLRRRLGHAPRWVLEALEFAYAAVYLAVAGGALLVWSGGIDALARYWSIVLAAELACYGALPWIRTRPPRTLEPPGPMDTRRVWWRSFNRFITRNVSVHANTLPSGHVAGAVAAAAAVWMAWPAAGSVLMMIAALISVASFVGRYHYLVDIVLGGAVAMAAAMLL